MSIPKFTGVTKALAEEKEHAFDHSLHINILAIQPRTAQAKFNFNLTWSPDVLQRQNSCLILHTVGKREGKENQKKNPKEIRFEAMSDLHNLRYLMFSVIRQASGWVGIWI